MKAFLECGSCGKQSVFEINGASRCPHCKSDKAKRMVVGSQPPEWFRESAKDNFFARLLGKQWREKRSLSHSNGCFRMHSMRCLKKIRDVIDRRK